MNDRTQSTSLPFGPPRISNNELFARSSEEIRLFSSEELDFNSVTDLEVTAVLSELGVPRSKALLDTITSQYESNNWLFPSFSFNASKMINLYESLLSYFTGLKDEERQLLSEYIEENVKYKIHYSNKWSLVFSRYLLPDTNYTFRVSSMNGVKDTQLASLTTTLSTQTTEKLASESKTDVSAGIKGVVNAQSHAILRSEISQQITRTLNLDSARQFEISEQKEFQEEMSFKVDNPSWYSVWQLIDVIRVERINRKVLEDDRFSAILDAVSPKIISEGECYSSILANSL